MMMKQGIWIYLTVPISTTHLHGACFATSTPKIPIFFWRALFVFFYILRLASNSLPAASMAKTRPELFVETNKRQAPSETGKSPPSQKEKAQLRRAQVRKAQIQHRQRKANYVKELELDVSRYRELIAKVEHEAANIKSENDAIRIRLRAAGVDETAGGKISESVSGDILTAQMQGQQLQDHGRKPPAPEEEGEMFADIDMDDLTVTVAYDETIGGPCFQVSSNSSGESVRTPITPNTVQGEQILSPAQEYQVINFILA
jgi:hypothetical protein